MINDLPQATNYFNYTMFADDCTLACYVPKQELSLIHNGINENLLSVYQWLASNRIQINVDKTKYIVYSCRNYHQLSGAVKINVSVVEPTNNIKFLGIFLDNNLSYRFHINNLSSKISRSLGVLNKISSFIPLNILYMLYCSLISPYICYAVEVWFCAPAYLTNKVNILQKKSVRCINRAEYNAHTEPFFTEMKLLKVADLHKYMIGIYMYKVVNVQGFDSDVLQSLTRFADVHNHATRQNGLYMLPRVNKEKFRGSIKYVGVNVWNEIPARIRDCSSIFKFKKHYKSYLLEVTI